MKKRRNKRRLKRLATRTLYDLMCSIPGVCRYCGCTDVDPCFHPDYGTCWWADARHTKCSHCVEGLIKNDERTIHCAVSRGYI